MSEYYQDNKFSAKYWMKMGIPIVAALITVELIFSTQSLGWPVVWMLGI